MDRKQLLEQFSPQYSRIEPTAPLQVGNGELAFSMDVTGLQTLGSLYLEQDTPLVTMSQWWWHTMPVSQTQYAYSPSDIQQTEYKYAGRKVSYPTRATPPEVYNWLRQNPHKGNLLEVSLVLDEAPVQADMLTDINQRLILNEGLVESRYQIKKRPYHVTTLCDSKTDTLAFSFDSAEFESGAASINLRFPYAAANRQAMQDTSSADQETKVLRNEVGIKQFRCLNDRDNYYVTIAGDCQLLKIEGNVFRLILSKQQSNLTVSFAKDVAPYPREYDQVVHETKQHWKSFWETTGFVDFTKSTNPKALELERRVILSQYLLAIQDTGNIPPQETGLLSNSWFGKPHLEMHLWHAGYMPLWHRTEDLLPSLQWYLDHQKEAEANAARNGYKGLRWPKMTSPDGIDSPSNIGPLIIWQESHIIYLLELVYMQSPDKTFLKRFWPLVKGTITFMADFLVKNQRTGEYELVAPIFPSQERFDPTKVLNPTFEIEYWRFGFKLAIKWATRLNEDASQWIYIMEHMVRSTIHKGVYISHQNCPETFDSVAIDHPSMLGIYGLIPNDRIDIEAYSRTLDKVLEVWDFDTLWGWDFGMMSMAATRLGKPNIAISVLLSDTPKNQYEKNGHNRQAFRDDLPAYLPGNGSLLLAVALMVAGYPGSEKMPGIPRNDGWVVEYENISAFPY